MQFKVGDIVKLTKASPFYPSELEYVGQTGEITNIAAEDNYPIRVKFKHGNTWFLENQLVLVKGGTMPKTLYNLEIGDIIIDDYDNKKKVLAVLVQGENPVYVLSESYSFDEADGLYTAKELERKDYKVVGEQTELTMDEIADKFGVSVEQLKIKKD